MNRASREDAAREVVQDYLNRTIDFSEVAEILDDLDIDFEDNDLDAIYVLVYDLLQELSEGLL